MRFLKLLIYGFFALLFLVFGIPFFLPDSVELSQSIKIEAEARQVFRLVNDFEKWKLWSPFQLDNPDIEARVLGAPAGVGSKLTYKSNTAGNGEITIVESQPYSRISMLLGMQKGGVAVDNWRFEQSGDTVEVTWTFRLKDLKYPFHRYFGFFSRSLMTPFQQKGLEKLKEVAMVLPPLLPIDTVVVEPFGVVAGPMDNPELPMEESLRTTSQEVLKYLSGMGIMAGDGLLGVYDGMQSLPPVKPLVGYPVAADTRLSGGYRYVVLSGGKAVTTSLVGSLSDRSLAYDEIELFMREFHLQRDSAKPILEYYSPVRVEAEGNNQPLIRFVVFLKDKPAKTDSLLMNPPLKPTD